MNPSLHPLTDCCLLRSAAQSASALICIATLWPNCSILTSKYHAHKFTAATLPSDTLLCLRFNGHEDRPVFS